MATSVALDEKTVAPRKHWAQPRTPQRGRFAPSAPLWVYDPLGTQVADLFCFALDDKRDALSSGRSIDYNETIAFSIGHHLYAQSGRPMLRICEDTCCTHDFLVTPCSLQMFQMMARNDAYHPSCLENLVLALAPHGIAAHQIGTTFNVFMNVPVEPGGQIQVLPPPRRPERSFASKPRWI